jgi:hypothetical protein
MGSIHIEGEKESERETDTNTEYNYSAEQSVTYSSLINVRYMTK